MGIPLEPADPRGESSEGSDELRRITAQVGAGRYEVRGVRFSMPGWWTLSFRIDAAAGTDSVTFNLKL